jgi:Xaa-Pro dipeptidase
MSITAESTLLPVITGDSASENGPERRPDVEAKQGQIAQLLNTLGCEGLLILEPENFAWMTSGAVARAVLDPASTPALYVSAEQRWLIAANSNSQRLFDEEIDGLGFQLKEWPWHGSRDRLLAEICQGRTVACDRPFGELLAAAEPLQQLRRSLSVYEQACLSALGLILSHALEAACRTMTQGLTEREVAGQVTHRLIHRGALPVYVGVAADGRSRLYREFGFTSTPIQSYAVLTATARKYGLCATASRAVSFGTLDPQFKAEHSAACKVCATYLASTWPDALPREILAAGRRVYSLTGHEHEWRLCPQGHVTARLPVELALTPTTEDLFQPGWGVTWNASVGAACSCDTLLVTESGPRIVTPTETWPLKRIRIQGAEFDRPDVLPR